MSIVIGVDPGSRITGYGVLQLEQKQVQYLAHGCVKTKGDDLADKLFQIFSALDQVILTYSPTVMVVEQVFFAKNAQSALKLGQARGAALTVAAKNGLELVELSAKQIKSGVVGYGAANKQQVQQMVKILLGLKTVPQSDAADALAAALCYCQQQPMLNRLGRAKVTAGEGS